MNKAMLVEAVAKRMGSREAAANAVDAVLDAIVREVAVGSGRVSVTGFGSFEKIDRPARYARNPQTGERVRVKKTSVPRFRAGQGFKDLVAGTKKLPKNDIAVKKAPKRIRDPKTGELVAPPRKKIAAKKTAPPKKTAARATTAKKTASKRTSKRAATKRTTKTVTAKKATAKTTSAKRTTSK